MGEGGQEGVMNKILAHGGTPLQFSASEGGMEESPSRENSDL